MGNINTYGFILNYQVGGLSVYKCFLRLEASHASLTKLIIVLKHQLPLGYLIFLPAQHTQYFPV